jgi:uncharacterized membrane protein YqhA
VNQSQLNRIEALFELFLWKFRLFTLLPVVFGLLSTLAFFVLGSVEIVEGLLHPALGGHGEPMEITTVMAQIIGGVDNYLIGVVLLIFSFGIYELFVSPLDIRQHHADVQILRIETLGQLKGKILQVIVMALVVSFFKKVITITVATITDALYLAIAILLVAASVYLVSIHVHPSSGDPDSPHY